MPIEFIQDGKLIIRFGRGDLTPCHLTDRRENETPCANVLGFIENDQPYEVGETVGIKLKDGMPNNLFNVFLAFDKVESVDVVVKQLLEIRKSMMGHYSTDDEPSLSECVEKYDLDEAVFDEMIRIFSSEDITHPDQWLKNRGVEDTESYYKAYHYYCGIP